MNSPALADHAARREAETAAGLAHGAAARPLHRASQASVRTPCLPSPALRRLLAALLAATALLASVPPAAAAADPSEASALSLLPVAMVVAAPSVLVSGAAALTVVGVQASAAGTVWVLERASDGARCTLQLSGGASLAVGSAVAVSAVGAGWVLSAAGRAIAFVPNEIGAALLHNEQVTR